MFHYIIAPTLEMRNSPQETSEVVSQAFFSEEIKVLEDQGEWVKIATAIDGYEGWSRKQGIFSRAKPYGENAKMILSVNRLAAHVYQCPDTIYGPLLTLPYESRLLASEFVELDARWIPIELPDGRNVYIQRGDISFGRPKIDLSQMEVFSQRFLGIPYTWGGRSSFGFDCSGFVQMLYRQMGINLPRDAKDQFLFSKFKDCPLPALSLGDLIFFGFSKDKIRHVGFYLQKGYFIHTSAVIENMPFLRINHIDDPAWNGQGHYPFIQGKKLGMLNA